MVVGLLGNDASSATAPGVMWSEAGGFTGHYKGTYWRGGARVREESGPEPRFSLADRMWSCLPEPGSPRGGAGPGRQMVREVCSWSCLEPESLGNRRKQGPHKPTERRWRET